MKVLTFLDAEAISIKETCVALMGHRSYGFIDDNYENIMEQYLLLAPPALLCKSVRDTF